MGVFSKKFKCGYLPWLLITWNQISTSIVPINKSQQNIKFHPNQVITLPDKGSKQFFLPWPSLLTSLPSCPPSYSPKHTYAHHIKAHKHQHCEQHHHPLYKYYSKTNMRSKPTWDQPTLHTTHSYLLLHTGVNFESFDSNSHPSFLFAEHLSTTYCAKSAFAQLAIKNNILARDLPFIQCQATRVVRSEEAKLSHAFAGGAHFGVIARNRMSGRTD